MHRLNIRRRLPPLPVCRQDIRRPPWAQQPVNLPQRATLSHIWPIRLTCLPLPTDTLAGPTTPPSLATSWSSPPTTAPQLVVTVPSLCRSKPPLASTPLKPPMQTLETLLSTRMDLPIPLSLSTRLPIPCSPLQHLCFRLKTPEALPYAERVPRVALEALITLPISPMTFRMRPFGLDIIYRVRMSVGITKVDRINNTSTTSPSTVLPPQLPTPLPLLYPLIPGQFVLHRCLVLSLPARSLAPWPSLRHRRDIF